MAAYSLSAESKHLCVFTVCMQIVRTTASFASLGRDFVIVRLYALAYRQGPFLCWRQLL